jgi:hypothetical protein
MPRFQLTRGTGNWGRALRHGGGSGGGGQGNGGVAVPRYDKTLRGGRGDRVAGAAHASTSHLNLSRSCR